MHCSIRCVLVAFVISGVASAQQIPDRLRRIFGGAAPQKADEAAATAQDKPAAGDAKRDAVDSRAPENRQVSRILGGIREQVVADPEAVDWGTVVPRLQGVLNEPSDGLIRIRAGTYSSMRREANRLLAQMPGAWRQRYVTQYEALARRSLNQATDDRDYSGIGNIATRFLQTPSGIRAARMLALRHIDRGEFALARHWLDMARLAGHQPKSDLEKLQAAIVAKVSDGETPDLSGFGDGYSAEALVQGLTSLRGEQIPLGEWWMLSGNAGRNALVVDRLPLMLRRWSESLLLSERLRPLVRDYVRSVLDSQAGVFLAGTPLVVGEIAACRTNEGVSVFDLRTGQLRWTTQRAGSAVGVFRKPIGLRGPSRSSSYQYGASRTEAVIQSFLFRDGIHGLLSSDGERLFVIEEQNLQPGRSSYRSSRDADSPLDLTNELAAYRLSDGSRAWAVGGPPMSRLFDSELTGHYFHGVPVAKDGELFVIGEKSNRIYLHAIDAATGELRWSQLIAFADTSIAADTQRRKWTAQICLADGILVCPTSVGWLVGVDPLTRTVLWAHRYSKPSATPPARRPGRAYAARPLVNQWPASAPIAAGRYIVCTPAEADVLACIELATGRRVWQQEKKEARYVPGIAGEHLILVSLSGIRAVRVKDHRLVWQVRFGDEGYPAGRGVLSSTHLHQPMSSGRIVSFDLSNGRQSAVTGTVNNDRMLANLVMYADGFLLQSATDLQAFELKPPPGTDPLTRTDAQKLRHAQVLFADGQTRRAIAQLDEIAADGLSNVAKAERNRLLASALQRVFESDPANAEVLDRLATLSDADAVTRLRIVQAAAAGHPSQAFGLLLQVYANPSTEPIAVRSDRIVVERDAWLSGQLADVWRNMDVDQRAETFAGIGELSESAHDAASRQRFVDTFAFHPLAADVIRERLNPALSESRFVEAEAEVRRLIRHATPGDSGQAVVKLALALKEADQHSDAKSILADFLKQLPRETAAGTQDQKPDAAGDPADDKQAGVRTRISTLIDELDSSPLPDLAIDWEDSEWTLRRFTGHVTTARPVPTRGLEPNVRFLHDHLAETRAMNGANRLVFRRIDDGTMHWSLPAQGIVANALMTNGRSILVLQSGTSPMIRCLSPLEKRELWRRPVVSASYRSLPSPFQAIESYQTGFNSITHPPVVTSPDYVVLPARRSFEVVDAVTGRLRWTCRSVSGRAPVVLGTDSAVVVGTGKGRFRTYRATDGKRLEARGERFAARAVTTVGDCLIVSSRTVFFVTRQELRSVNLLTGKTVWVRRFPGDARMTHLDRDHVLILRDASSLDLVDLTNGEVRTFRLSKPMKQRTRVFVGTDGPRIFVGTNETGSSFFRSGSVPVHGRLYVLDRSTGKELWTRAVSNGGLVTSSFSSSPLLFVTEGRTESSQSVSLTALDRQTGQTLAKTRVNLYYSGHTVTVNPARRHVELSSYNQRLRFRATPKSR